MAKKSTIVLSAQELLTKKNGKYTGRKVKDSDIDYSDIPKLSKEHLGNFKRRGRPVLSDTARVAISIRIDADVLRKLKQKAESKRTRYQSLINEILKKAV